MRKKSHISLGKFLANNLEYDTYRHYKKAFVLGNLLPDCKLSFLTKRHEFDVTFNEIEEEIERLSDLQHVKSMTKTAFMRDLGQVVHFIADYFTFPHNSHYPGNLREHCVYEEELKHALRKFIIDNSAEEVTKDLIEIKHREDISVFIKEEHRAYMKTESTVFADCQYIFKVTNKVVKSILYSIELQREEEMLAAELV